ncbi:HEPN domain-containing protein [Brevundimonas diminuta]|uniref:nucleotidyltransferase and HEPN domain-containing protein n=1 Tax=Brevundimonas diminuta TaxID=293 RepID=UPI002096BC08|nr:HEPN domain-containing protein [Brevundimonas diminuta]MCO8018696.1 HEPN domain-containing protein [Brevundimonas diminuta]MCO8020452.1 HEPN domain-containing protein [Brevundimonas diminuta]
MRADLDHLPAKQQRELERVRTTLLTEFDAAIKSGGGGTQSWRRDGRVLKIILFGSYARNDWVDEPDNGYLSDFDLLVIVSHEKLTDIADYWYVAEDKVLRDPAVGRTVNIIVHTMAEVNQALTRGEYFWTDIVHDGVVLYELPGHPFAQPQPMTALEARAAAQRYFDARIKDLNLWIDDARRHVAMGGEGQHVRKRAAFLLHQATETAYACFLLTHTFYFPRSHNIKFLRSLAEDTDKRLTAAWPREQRADRRRFEFLKRAYVEARYSDQYDVERADLEQLLNGALQLRDLVVTANVERIAKLAEAAEPGTSA